MSKTLETLFEKAKINGVATKNGRIKEYDFGLTYVGDLREQWAIEFNSKTDILELRHWGTVLMQFECLQQRIELNTIYAQSRTDVTALNWFFDKLQIPLKANYYPSKEMATISSTHSKTILKKIE